MSNIDFRYHLSKLLSQ